MLKWLVSWNDEEPLEFFKTEEEAIAFAKLKIEEAEEYLVDGDKMPNWIWDLCVMEVKHHVVASTSGLYLMKGGN